MTDYDQIIFRKYKIDHAVQQQFSHAESFCPIARRDSMILKFYVRPLVSPPESRDYVISIVYSSEK